MSTFVPLERQPVIDGPHPLLANVDWNKVEENYDPDQDPNTYIQPRGDSFYVVFPNGGHHSVGREDDQGFPVEDQFSNRSYFPTRRTAIFFAGILAGYNRLDPYLKDGYKLEVTK